MATWNYDVQVDGTSVFLGDKAAAEAEFTRISSGGEFLDAVRVYRVRVAPAPKMVLEAKRNGVVVTKKVRKPRAKKVKAE